MENRSFRKSLAIAVVALFLGVSVIPSVIGDNPSFVNTIYVDGDNTEGPWDGTESHPYQYIQEAIDNSSDGDTVFIFAGIYNENLLLNKSINLMGENRDNTIIDGKGKSPVIFISVDNCSVSKLTTRNGHYDNILISSSNNTINDNIIEKAIDFGIRLSKDNNVVRNNLIKENNFGAVYLGSSGNSIFNNIIKNNGRGIQLRIAGNSIYNNQFLNDGIWVYYYVDMVPPYPNYVYNNIINGKKLVYMENEKNKIIEDEAGQVFLIECKNITIKNNEIEKINIGIHIVQCDKISINNNYIHSIGDKSIFIHGGGNVYLYKNKICNSSSLGIYILGSDNNCIESNNITNNRFGIYLHIGCSNTEIVGNMISSNYAGNIDIVVSKHTKIHENYIGNYYSTGNDLSSGIGIDSSSHTDIYKNNIVGNSFGIFRSISFLTTIKQNNIYGNDVDATFFGGFFNKWENNYWGSFRFFPKLILGGKFPYLSIPFGSLYGFPWLEADWHPAKEPYDIQVPEVP